MKILLLLLFIAISAIQSHGQEMKCYCFEKDTPTLIKLQTDAAEIVEWIVIKDHKVAVVSYMDKSCEQPWSFFEQKFEEHKDKNRVYQIKELGDSIMFTKVFNFNVKDQALAQEYIYNAKIYSDSLKVHIDYPASENTGSVFNDMTGSPDRTYIRVLKK